MILFSLKLIICLHGEYAILLHKTCWLLLFVLCLKMCVELCNKTFMFFCVLPQVNVCLFCNCNKHLPAQIYKIKPLVEQVSNKTHQVFKWLCYVMFVYFTKTITIQFDKINKNHRLTQHIYHVLCFYKIEQTSPFSGTSIYKKQTRTC